MYNLSSFYCFFFGRISHEILFLYSWFLCLHICSCPRDASPSAHAQPKALSGKQLGGVDQATLRQSLSRHGDSQNPMVDYLNDSELWTFTDTVRQLEAMQLSIVKNDIQVKYIGRLILVTVLGGGG